MKDNYDFSKAVKNPYIDKIKDGYTVTVRHDSIKRNDYSPGNDDKNRTQKQAQ